ncbi:MAG: hypothetical protein ACM3N0_02485, partial [Chloroflexota bacterium]
ERPVALRGRRGATVETKARFHRTKAREQRLGNRIAAQWDDGAVDGVLGAEMQASRRSESAAVGDTLGPMTAKERLLREVLDLDEARATRAQIVVVPEIEPESKAVPLPAGWGETLTGEPMPDVAAAVRRSRESH